MASTAVVNSGQHALGYGRVLDWDYTAPGWLRIILAVAMLLVTVAVAGRRIAWLVKLIRSGQPATAAPSGIEERVKDQLVEVFGQRKLLKWTAPGHRALLHVLGLRHPRPHHRRGVRRAGDQQGLRVPDLRARPLARVRSRTSSPSRCCVAIAWFAVNRLRNAPERKQRGSRFYGSHTGPAWVILGMISLVVDHPAALPRRAVQHRALPVGQVEGAVRVLRRRQAARRRRVQPGRRDVLPARADGGDLRFHDPGRLLQAPAHRHRAAERADQARAGRPRPAAAGHRRRGQADRLRRRREPVRGHRLRQGQDRGLQLEGLPRLRDVHRVRPLPVPVPGVEHRQAAVAQAGDHGPARSPVRQGAVHHRRASRCRTTRCRPRRRRRARAPRARRPASRASRDPTTGAGGATARRRPAPAAASSTRTCSGRAPPAARASSSARSTSSTSTTSSTCAATRC